ncbi:hypothetical protein NQ317_007478 [Molorchus minor]|uniref:Uncharacterized protein n=1 Tax=Molorchus minor TaxID=1323400 RepID=A0ABQ9K103_9CUCU|nr:hypothetical protein NQ317_007478 [Molorchus minor]
MIQVEQHYPKTGRENMMNNNKILGSNKKSPKRLPQQSNKISSWLNKSDEQRKEVCNNSIHIKKEKSDLKIGDNYDRELVATNNNINHKANATKQKSYVLVEGPWLSKEGEKLKGISTIRKNKDLKEPLKLEHKHSNPCSDQRLVGGQVCKTSEKQSSGDGYLQISPRNKVTLSASPTRNIASEFENTNSAKHAEKQTTPVKERVNIHPTLRRSPRTQKSKQLGSSPEINIGTDKIKSLYRETTPIRQKCEVSPPKRSPRNLGLPKSSPTGTAKRLFKNIEDSHSNTLNTRLDKNAMKGREKVLEKVLGMIWAVVVLNRIIIKKKNGNYKDRKENNIRGDWRKDKISAEEKHKKESKPNKTSSIKTKERSSYHDRDKTFKRIDNDYKSEGEVPSKKRIKLDRTMNKKEIKETKEKRDELRKNKHYSKSHVHTEEPSSKTSESKSISQKKKKSHTKWIEPKTEDKAETKTEECEKNKKGCERFKY